jgi:hypothetical protein
MEEWRGVEVMDHLLDVFARRMHWSHCGRKKRAILRPKSVEGVSGKNSDAKNDEKGCNSFKH